SRQEPSDDPQAPRVCRVPARTRNVRAGTRPSSHTGTSTTGRAAARVRHPKGEDSPSMKGPTIITKVKSLNTRRLRRSVLLLGMVAATAGATLFSAASAPAAVGSQPGNLQLTPPSGSDTSTPTWSTTTACPTGFQGSAVLFALNTDGSVGSQIGVGTQTAVTAPFGGALLGNVAAL